MIKKIIIYTIAVIALAYALQWFVLEGLRRNKEGIYEKYNTIFFKQNSYSTIMMGSSRMFMHLDNNLFDSLTQSNSYNIGLPGATMRLSYACLRAYCVKSKIPQQVFLELDYQISHITTDTIYNFSTYFPFLQNEVLYQQFKTIDKRFVQFKYNPFYELPFLGINSLSASLNGWTKRSGYYDHYFKKGFFKNELYDDYNHVLRINKDKTMSEETKSYLDSTVVFCKKHQIKLFFTMSPAYKDAINGLKHKETIIKQFEDLAKKEGITVFNYSKDSLISNNKSYFEDSFHMLYPGARIYTQKIAQDFNNIPR